MGTKNTGDSVVSTLSADLQTTAYNSLGDRRGAVVALEPSTGKILAMVSKPDFDPNTISENWDSLVNDETNSSLLNRATMGQYPPGSTFKVVTALDYFRTHGSFNGFSFDCQGSITKEGTYYPVLQRQRAWYRRFLYGICQFLQLCLCRDRYRTRRCISVKNKRRSFV